MDLKWLVYLIGTWFGEEDNANIIMTHVSKRLGYLQILITTPHSVLNTIERTYQVSNQEINKHVLPIPYLRGSFGKKQFQK